MYNLRLFMHNKLVIIELVAWWHTVIHAICTTEEVEPNRQGCTESTTCRDSICLFATVWSRNINASWDYTFYPDSITTSCKIVCICVLILCYVIRLLHVRGKYCTSYSSTFIWQLKRFCSNNILHTNNNTVSKLVAISSTSYDIKGGLQRFSTALP